MRVISMLRILGSPRRLCDDMTRREMLRVGGLTAGAAGLSNVLPVVTPAAEPHAASHAASFGRAKRVLFLFLYGAAPQHETFDPKPEAPAEIRGPFQPIDTIVPGLRINENFPLLARVADRMTVIRSMTHPFPVHSSAYTMSGIDKVDIPMELGPYDPRHWPCFGSVLDYLERRKNPHAAPPAVPRNMALPFLFSSREWPHKRGGPYAGFLGRSYNPIWTEFEGTATRSAYREDGTGSGTVADPFLGITPDARFYLPDGEGVTLDRLRKRRSLLEQLDDQRQMLDRTAATVSLDHFKDMAYSLIGSRELRDALDLRKESDALRERYGMTLFGQATLAGRRLLEAGAQTVTVIWDEYTIANTAWDTHNRLVTRIRDELAPGLDRALSALLVDLEERGMLDDTLVLCLTEHGRTPQIVGNVVGAGRDHWSDVYNSVVAGGGFGRGRVVGSSDKHGAFVKDTPITPKDVLCTMYHLLGIDPHLTIPDRLGRPVPLVSGGEVQQRLLA